MASALLQATYQAVCSLGLRTCIRSSLCAQPAAGVNAASARNLCGCMQVKKDFQEAVLSYRQDEFFRKNMYANFGDIGAAVKELVDEFQKQTNNTKRINTIEDMQV